MSPTWRVTCDAPVRGGYFAASPCRFDGYRKAASAQQAARRPCPRCGGPVQVTPTPIGAAMEHEDFTTAWERIPCPTCGAPAGERCEAMRGSGGWTGSPREPLRHQHLARMEAGGLAALDDQHEEASDGA